MNRIIVLALVVTLIGVAVIIGWFFLGNQLQGQKGFEIYLSENNELVISDKDIMFYNWTSHNIRLNSEGIDRIKGMDFYEKLYHKSFVVMLNGKEMYNGSFWSDADSMPPSGIVILDIIAIQYGKTDTLRIEPCYPSVQFCKGVDPRNNSEIFDHFQSIGKLVQ
jgi:hypothetical protein